MPTISKKIGSASPNESKELIAHLNELLSKYHQASLLGQGNLKSILEDIVKTSDEFISAIPQNLRSNIILDPPNQKLNELNLNYPNLMEIIELQKNAVHLLSLPFTPNVAKSNWMLLKQFFTNDNNASQSKHLAPQYFQELKFQGNVHLSQWIHSQGVHNRNLWSKSETLQHEQEQTLLKKKILYFDDPTPYQLHFKNGIVYDNQNQLFDTSKGRGVNVMPGHSIFVFSTANTVYASNPKEDVGAQFHHSSFVKGRPIRCAGSLVVQNGEITEVWPDSGHYMPTRKEMLIFLKFLEEDCLVDLSKVRVLDHPTFGSPHNAKEYLQKKGYFPGEFSYKQFNQSRILNKEHAKAALESAVSMGHYFAIYSKAKYQLDGKGLYEKDIMAALNTLYNLSKENIVVSEDARDTLKVNGYKNLLNLPALIHSPKNLGAYIEILKKSKNIYELNLIFTELNKNKFAIFSSTSEWDQLVTITQNLGYDFAVNKTHEKKSFTSTEDKILEGMFKNNDVPSNDLMEKYKKLKESNNELFPVAVDQIRTDFVRKE